MNMDVPTSSASGSKRKTSFDNVNDKRKKRENTVLKMTEKSEDSDTTDDDAENSVMNQFKIEHKWAFGSQTQSYRIYLHETDPTTTVKDVFDKLRDTLMTKLREAIDIFDIIKSSLKLEICLDYHEYETFNLDATTVLRSVSDIKSFMDLAERKIESKYNELESRQIKQFLFLILDIHKIVKSSFELTLPEQFKDHIIDSKPIDDRSFTWSVLTALIGEYEYDVLEEFLDTIDMKGINYPVQLDDIKLIEEKNKFSVNVYMLKYDYESKSDEIEGPIYHTKERKNKHVNLLLLHDTERSRFCYIKNLKSLICPDKDDSHFCDGCLSLFDEDTTLKWHQQKECLRIKTTFPKEKTMKFCNSTYSEKVPFVVYADFEALLEDVESVPKDTIKYTINVRKHVPYSYGYYIKCVDDNFSVIKTYVGPDCVCKFTESLKSDLKAQYLQYIGKTNTTIHSKHVPVYLHNLQNYDCHFIIQESTWDYVLGGLSSYLAMHCKLEIGMVTIQMRFLDSMNFLKDKLQNCVQTLNEEDFHEIKNICRNDEDLPFLTEKGVMPYNYIKSFEDLNRTKLPDKKHFYDNLTDTEISEEAYLRALKVWDHFGCETIEDYSLLYLKTDVLLLADVFEKLRRSSYCIYQLDIAHYYSLSGFSWDAMLKHTNVELELLSDVEMINFVKRGIRAGYAHCSKRHAVANNKYLKNYNDKIDESYIMYYDANNLYGYAMSQPLPYGGFEWVPSSSIAKNEIDIYDVSEDSEIGYILEVDFSYPKKLHDLHSDLPFCPEKKNVPDTETELLVTDLNPKRNYILHHSYLALFKKHDLEIDTIRRVLKFKQKPWLKSYIHFNNERRKMAVTESDKNLYKLMNNVIFGKTMQKNDYPKIKTFDHWENTGYKRGAFNSIGRPDYKRHTICSKNTVVVEQQNTMLNFKYPIYIGFCILDLSKTHMYKFHYNFMKKLFGDRLCLLYTDTDSFIYHIKIHDYYSTIKPHLNEYFDTSNYEIDNQFQIPILNKMELGYFKDEMKGAVVKEFVGLRPKMYVIEAENNTIKKASGVPVDVSKKFTTKDYRNCLYKNEKSYIEYFTIRAVGHDLYTQKVRKVGLSPLDAKRHILDNHVDTLPWGHYKLTNHDRED